MPIPAVNLTEIKLIWLVCVEEFFNGSYTVKTENVTRSNIGSLGPVVSICAIPTERLTNRWPDNEFMSFAD